MLVEQYRQKHGDGEDKEIRTEINKAVSASPSLRNRKDLIDDFVNTVSMKGTVDDQWQEFIDHSRDEELQTIIREEGLKPQPTERFMDEAFRNGTLQTGGTAIATILPPVSRFIPQGGHGKKKQQVIDRLSQFFGRFRGLGENQD